MKNEEQNQTTAELVERLEKEFAGLLLAHNQQVSVLMQERFNILKDKARLDWLENQTTAAFWKGAFSDSEHNINLGRVGAPIATLSTMDADGNESLGDEIGSGESFRSAIDKAIELEKLYKE